MKTHYKHINLQELEDGSLYSCPMEDYIDDKTHFLVDVPACENPDWNKAMHEMITGSSQNPEEPKEEEKTTKYFGDNDKLPEPLKENKYEVVKDLTEQGKSAKEIREITGYSKNLVYQYQYKIRQEQLNESQTVTPGHNADRHLCKTCMWRSNDNNIKSGTTGCEYSVKNNHTRGCKVEDCTVYKKGDPKNNTKPITI